MTGPLFQKAVSQSQRKCWAAESHLKVEPGKDPPSSCKLLAADSVPCGCRTENLTGTEARLCACRGHNAKKHNDGLKHPLLLPNSTDLKASHRSGTGLKQEGLTGKKFQELNHKETYCEFCYVYH